MSGHEGDNPRPSESYRCLILGSTELEVENALWAAGYAGEIVSSDIAEKAMARCRTQAAEQGRTNVEFVVADLNKDGFEGPFDIIICNGVLHHIVEQERCLDMLQGVLAKNGVLIAAEFTGPYRFQLPPEQVHWINVMLDLMPVGMRMPESLGRPFAPVAEEILVSIDPTEAISGYKLDDNLLRRFDVVERGLAGGTLTTYCHEWVDYRTTNSGEYETWMRAFVQFEQALIESGKIKNDFAFYVLKSK